MRWIAWASGGSGPPSKISENACRGADSRADIRIAQRLGAAGFEAESFDQIIIWHVLEHLQACHDIELAGMLGGHLLGADLTIGDIHAAGFLVQAGHGQRGLAHVDSRDARAAMRHRLAEEPAAAAHVDGRLPARFACSSMKLRRSGLMSCSGLNSLSGSHQRLASASNLAISA